MDVPTGSASPSSQIETSIPTRWCGPRWTLGAISSRLVNGSRATCLKSCLSADAKFELLKDHSQLFEPRQQWLPIGRDCVTQQPNQRPAIVLGQVQGAFSLQRVTTGHSAAPFMRGLLRSQDRCIL